MKKARQKVLAWWREQLHEYAPAIRVTENVEESFGDGLAILALMHKLDPSSVDLEAAKRKRRMDGWDGKRENLELAFSLAQSQLRIEPLLDARDMCAEDAMSRPDDQCILVRRALQRRLARSALLTRSAARRTSASFRPRLPPCTTRRPPPPSAATRSTACAPRWRRAAPNKSASSKSCADSARPKRRRAPKTRRA